MSTFARLPDGSYALMTNVSNIVRFMDWVETTYAEGGAAGTDVLVRCKALLPDNSNVSGEDVAAPLRMLWFTTQPPPGWLGA